MICVCILSRWWFAGGLYMMKLAPENLRLTAMYGLIIAASVICFGASVGNWIDKTRRITGIWNFIIFQLIYFSFLRPLIHNTYNISFLS